MRPFFVPQFIDVESKIIGPISGRQFVIIIITFGLVYIFFKLLPIYFFALVGFVLASSGSALAFGKVNGQTMHYFLLSLIQTRRRPHLRVWKRTKKIIYNEQAQESLAPLVVKFKGAVTKSRLAEVSLTIDTGGKYGEEFKKNVDNYGIKESS